MQQRLFSDEGTIHAPAGTEERSEWGTFRDSLRAPVHSWFTYPAGFSYRAVRHSLRALGLSPNDGLIYDPFMGSGTTNLVAKVDGYDSAGVEAHPFVFDITATKMHWDVDESEIHRFLSTQLPGIHAPDAEDALRAANASHFPALIQSCFLPAPLYELRLLRDTISAANGLSMEGRRFLRTALICTLRDVSTAATGWPYIAPKKSRITARSTRPIATYQQRVHRMLADLAQMRGAAAGRESNHRLVLGSGADSGLESCSVSHIFTSPPYLNNFDYADRTRLEMYFMGDAATWGDITRTVRTKLMTSATTQIGRSDPRYELSEDIRACDPAVYEALREARDELAERRLQKGGKKSYDLLVAGYFNDILPILRDNVRVLKKGGGARYILGDSAPYGVHVPTDEFIGRLALGLGCRSYEIEILRSRGGKWAMNPQRHSVALRESIVTVIK